VTCHKLFFRALLLQRLRRAASSAALSVWALCALWLWPLAAQATDFRPIFESHSAVMLLIEPETGRIVDANPAAVAFYGYTRDTLQRMQIQQINTLSEEQVAQERALANQEGRNYFIFRHRQSNGDIRTVEIYSSPFEFGTQRLLLSLVHDITPGRNLENGLWNYQQRLEEMVDQRTAQLQARNQWVLGALLLVSVFALALVWAHRRRKQIEGALSYRQGLFTALFERSGLLSGIVDCEGRLCEVNQRALQLIDLPAQAVIGQDFVNTPWWYTEDKPRLRQALARAAQGQADSFEAMHPSVNGPAISVQFHAVPVVVDEKAYIAVIGVDISEIKRLAAQEARNNRLFAAVFDHAEVGLALVSPAGKLLKVNEQFAAMVGYSSHDMVAAGFDFQRIIYADDLASDLEQMRQLLTGAADSYNLEKRYLHKDGHCVWVHVSVRLVRDEGQRPDYFVSAIIDVSRRKAAEISLQQAKTELERSEALLRRVIDAMPHIVIVKDAQGRFQLVNATLARLYQSTPEAMQGKDDGDFNANPEQVAFYRRNIQEIIESGEPQQVQEDSTDAATGEVRHFQSVKVPFAGPDGARSVLVVSTDITELFRTQKRLRLSEERMAFNFAATRDGLWDWWILEDRVDHNEQWGHVLGLKEVPLSHPVSFFAERIHPEDRDAVMARIGQALQTDCAYESEHRVIWPDGRVVWLLDRGRVVVRGSDGQALRMVGSVRDITERREMEERMRVQQRRLQSILDGTHVGTWEWNVQTGATVFNDRWASMLGYTLDELQPISIETWLRLAHPDDLQHSNALLQQHFANGEGFYDCESRMRHKDGHWIWVHDRGKVATWQNGQPLLMAGTHQDITVRKAAEQALKEAQARLQQSEHLLMDTEQLALVGGWVYEVDNAQMYWTPGLFRLHGFEATPDLDYVGESIRCYREQDRPVILRAFQACIEDCTPYDLVLPFVTHKGQSRWIRTKTKPVIEAGKTVKVLGIVMDITEQKHAEATLQAAVETSRQLAVQADAANMAKSRFLATMSHELRTPLNGVLGMAQLLLLSPPDERQFRDYARTILHSGQTLLNLLNDILDLSKVEAGRVTLDVGVVSPHETVGDTTTLFAFNAQTKGIALHGHWAGPALQRYQGDAHRLQQMLSNLVSNAIKFTHHGSVQVEAFEVSTDQTFSVLEFSVQDTGIGIESSQLPQLFQPFKQIDDSTSRHFGGTGLGLSIVKSLAKQMGGEVGVESVYGQGSRFWFRVRLQRLSVAASADHTLQASDGQRANPKPMAQDLQLQGRVLVVEDEPTNQTVIAAMLCRLGIEPLLAEHGLQALDLLAQSAQSAQDKQGIDAVLMDIHMPQLDGYETTARIRAWEAEHQRPPVPIVALTASAFGEDRARCLSAGMDAFLTKPINLDLLGHTLARWLSTQAAPTERHPVAVQTTAVVWPDVLQRLQVLMPLLAASKFAAVEQFNQLLQQVQGTPLAAELAAIRPDVEAFRFVQAGQALQTFIQNHSPDHGST
jgi:PAS domain S-box-containing protein